MLFVWLFALASGIVNACVPHAVSPDTAAALPERQVLDLADAHDGDDPAAAGHCDSKVPAPRGPCAKFCDDEATGVWNSKPPYDPEAPAGVVVQTMPTPMLADVQCEASASLASEAAIPPRLPVAIAFLRLRR